MKKIKQHFIPYWQWEDYINGMWRKLETVEEARMLKEAIDFTGDANRYGEAMEKVIVAWPNTMLHNLSNPSINRKAFLGHAACCFQFNCPEYITRIAWKELTDRQRNEANAKAEYHIKKWENSYEVKNRTVHPNMGKQMLLEWVA